MKKIENGNFHHTLVSALSCVLLMAVAGVLVSICSLDSLVTCMSLSHGFTSFLSPDQKVQGV